VFVGTDMACLEGGFPAINNGAMVNAAPMGSATGIAFKSGISNELWTSPEPPKLPVENPIHAMRIEVLGVEFRIEPSRPVLRHRMVRIFANRKMCFIAMDPATVLRWARALTRNAQRELPLVFNTQPVLDEDLVLPIIPEIVEVAKDPPPAVEPQIADSDLP
jgi:hypothetical protein